MAIILTFYPIFNLQIRNLLWNRPLVFGIMIITNLFKQNPAQNYAKATQTYDTRKTTRSNDAETN